MTGKDNGALVEIKKMLDMVLLWLACRHHVGELLLKDACLKSFKGKSSSPDVLFLKDLKTLWNGNHLFLLYLVLIFRLENW